MKKLSPIIFFLFILSINCYGIRKPKLLYPINSQWINQLDPVLQWKYPDKDNIRFEIKIAEDQYFKKNVREFSTKFKSFPCNIPYLESGGTYYWTVRAIVKYESGRSVSSKWSHEKVSDASTFRFLIKQDSKGLTGFQPAIKSPLQDMVVQSLQPTLEWEFPDFHSETYQIKDNQGNWVSPEFSNIYYHLMISESENFEEDSKTFQILENQRSFHLSLPLLEPEERYYWKVKAFYNDPFDESSKESGWSDEELFNQVTASFFTAQSAMGDFTFNEGLQEELYDIYSLPGVEQITSGDANCFYPAVSMNGQNLAFCSDERGTHEILTKRLQEKMRGGVTQKTSTQKGRYNFSPFWLFNDEEIGFFSNRYRKEHYHLFSTNRGTGVTIETPGLDMIENVEEFNLFGSCSTDGRIVFSVKFNENDTYMLYLLNLDENSLTQLRPGMFPDIRDDDRIVFCSNETGNYEIWMVELEGRSVFRPTILNNHLSDDFDPVLSPDGSRIAFASNRAGNTDIWIMNSDGTNIQQITSHPMADRRPQWVDDRSLIFQSNRDMDKEGNPVINIYKIQIDR